MAQVKICDGKRFYQYRPHARAPEGGETTAKLGIHFFLKQTECNKRGQRTEVRFYSGDVLRIDKGSDRETNFTAFRQTGEEIYQSAEIEVNDTQSRATESTFIEFILVCVDMKFH
ncbi:hypothetical protein J6590_038626 [Homalodisca vitripennis]|nr:hypothetical protein J6590_038626 [Homalodisca vitripennis]